MKILKQRTPNFRPLNEMELLSIVKEKNVIYFTVSQSFLMETKSLSLIQLLTDSTLGVYQLIQTLCLKEDILVFHT